MCTKCNQSGVVREVMPNSIGREKLSSTPILLSSTPAIAWGTATTAIARCI